MSELKSPEFQRALRQLRRLAPEDEEITSCEEFDAAVKDLIEAVQNETELSLLKGETRHLGEKHMLLSCVYGALSMSLRPVQREASFNEFKQALSIYLGIKLPKRTGKRQRRKLLLHL